MEYRKYYLTYKKNIKGKKIYYYYVRLDNGEKTVPHSTGKKTRNEAIKYCEDLLQIGKIEKNEITIEKFTYNFFSNEGMYIKAKDTKVISKNTIMNYQYSLNKNILPFLGKIKISKITPNIIRQWKSDLKNINQMANSSIRTNQGVLNIILKFAMEEGVINRNPMEFIHSNDEISKTRRAFVIDEIYLLLDNLSNSFHVLLCVYISLLTGLRLGEVLAIDRDCIYDNYLIIDKQHTVFNEITKTKTRISRFVPIPKKLNLLIQNTFEKNKSFYLFETEQKTIISNSYIQKKIAEVIPKIRIIHDKKLSFHSLRHFFNTYLIENDISERKIKEVMGHSSGSNNMTERYTTWNGVMFQDVQNLQEELINNIQANISNKTLSILMLDC